MSRWIVLVFLLCFGAICWSADVERFDHVKIHRHKSERDRALVDKVGVLSFDDANRKFTFSKNLIDKFDTPENVEVGYDSVVEVVFETTNRMRGGGLAQVISAATLAGAMIGPAIAGQHVSDYWFYCKYKTGEEEKEVLLVLPKDLAPKVIEKTSQLLGSRVVISEFPEKGEEVKRQELADRNSKHSLHVNRENRVVAEAKPDKATLVVVCPPLAARDTGKGNQFKLHANDHVVAVNKAGTYSIVYLDPGRYRLVSQSENANGFEMQLEAGKTYYFLQNTYQGALRWQTRLSHNSPELVTYLMSGTYLAEWARKE